MTEINKEIEEMADEIFNAGVGLDGVDFAYKSDHFDRLAIKLYNAGYRKESEVKAETAKWDMLCNRLGNIIANGDDCENNCCQGFLDMVNEIKHYDGEYERQLTAEVVKEFAEKVLKDISDVIDQNTSVAEAFGSVSPGVYNRALIANNACKGVYGTVTAIAKEYGVEVESDNN